VYDFFLSQPFLRIQVLTTSKRLYSVIFVLKRTHHYVATYLFGMYVGPHLLV